MTKVVQKICLIFFLISSIIFSTVYLVEPSENYDSDNKVKLSDSDSWTKIVKNGGRWSTLEIYNNSLYVFRNPGYVSKFDTSGFMLWEYTTNLETHSHVFDSKGHILILFEKASQDELLIIKLSSSGKLLYSKNILVGGYIHNTLITLGVNNSMIITGHSSTFELLIFKLNSNGDLLWNKTVSINSFWSFPFIVSDSKYNLYIPYDNNSLSLAKINGSGELQWKIGLGDLHPHANLMIDANDTLFLIGTDDENTSIFKINSSGFILKELKIDDFVIGNSWHFDDILVIKKRYTSELYCCDVNLNYKWNYNLSDHVISHFANRVDLARDLQGNIYILQTSYVGDISLLKINSAGIYVSQIIWGGPENEFQGNLIIDSENNLYFICYCDYFDTWGLWQTYMIMVKNPADGGLPPKPEINLTLYDYLLFSVFGISCIISLKVLIPILRSNKKRIG